MEANSVPVLAYVAFGVAWIAGLSLFGCLYLITRRLGMNWKRQFLSTQLDNAAATRLFKLLWGFETVQDGKVRQLVWAVRAAWAVMLVGVLMFVLLLTGVV